MYKLTFNPEISVKEKKNLLKPFICHVLWLAVGALMSCLLLLKLPRQLENVTTSIFVQHSLVT